MQDWQRDYPASPTMAALKGCCPRCGRGRLFSGWLSLASQCTVCSLNFHKGDVGDGPQILAMFLVSFVVAGLAIWVELAFTPELWLHYVLWPPVILLLSIATMRYIKAVIIAQQYVHRPEEFEKS